MHSSPKFGEHLYDHHFEFFIRKFSISISFRSLSEVLRVCVYVLLFGTYFSVSLFCLALCFCILGETATSLSLEGMALCRK